MNTIARTVVGLTTATVLAVPAALVTAGSASADPGDREVRGSLGSGSYEFGAEFDDGRIDVSLDGNNLPAGSRWKVVIKQDGDTIVRTVKRATRDDDDRGADWDVDRTVANSVGSDVFTMKIKRVGGKAKASDRIVLR